MRLATAPDGSPRLIQYFSHCGVWAVTPYTACDLRCNYCITFSQGRSAPRMDAGIDAAIREEVARVPPDGTLALGALVDAYPRAEGEVGLTRKVLRALVDTGRPVSISTKGPLVTRDIDLLLRGDVRVQVSLSALDDTQLAQVEPRVAPASERMRAIEELAAAGVDVQLQAQPWIPGLTDAEAIIDWADGRFRVWFCPLNIDSPGVARTPLGRAFTAAEIYAAYLAEAARLKGRRGVIWQKPGWMGFSARGAELLPEPGATSEETRNRAAIRRLVAAFQSGAPLETLLELVSPYARLVDFTGRATDREYPRSGRSADLLYGVAAALEAPDFHIRSLEAAGDRVDLELQVRGRHIAQLFDLAPSGEVISLPLAYRYRFDSQGLVLDYSQHADLDRLPALVG